MSWSVNRERPEEVKSGGLEAGRQRRDATSRRREKTTGLISYHFPSLSFEDAVHQCGDPSTVEQDFSNGGSQRNGFPA
ncbi:hypothetical protein L1049_004516 [Liquidambar formosana]|uniref:Uncharacterized protein n=1 Tax=Liquidambar formosana TaxID=63359 RepID=A0AAP0RP55_LIQFO